MRKPIGTSTSKKAKDTNDEATLAGRIVVGHAVMTALAEVKPNGWNPNRMTPFIRNSLKKGLEEDGWIASQALLVWGTDEKGRAKNLIIDGEHRWQVASEIGMAKGPMVFLHRLTEAQAKALTVKMNQKRGEFDEAGLGALLREIQYDLGTDPTLSLGIGDERMMKLLAEPAVPRLLDEPAEDEARGPEGSTAGIPASSVRMVQLFFNDETHAEFSERIRRLATVHNCKNVTDTVLAVIREAPLGD